MGEGIEETFDPEAAIKVTQRALSSRYTRRKLGGFGAMVRKSSHTKSGNLGEPRETLNFRLQLHLINSLSQQPKINLLALPCMFLCRKEL
jgi:hypothetical protein